MLLAIATILIAVTATVALKRRKAPKKAPPSPWEGLPHCKTLVDYLNFGRAMLGYSLGLVVEVTEEGFLVIDRSGEPHRAPTLLSGARLMPESLLCLRVVERGQIVTLQNMGCSLWRGHQTTKFLGMDSYVGVPIVRDGKIRYVLSFLDWGYRDSPFTANNRKFLQQLARWIDLVIPENQEENHTITENRAIEVHLA